MVLHIIQMVILADQVEALVVIIQIHKQLVQETHLLYLLLKDKMEVQIQLHHLVVKVVAVVELEELVRQVVLLLPLVEEEQDLIFLIHL